MEEKIKDIGFRIRSLRETKKLSQESLSVELKIPLEEYKNYENGEADIPIGFLYQIANIFEVELTSLITGEEPRLHSYCIVRKDKAPMIETRK